MAFRRERPEGSQSKTLEIEDGMETAVGILDLRRAIHQDSVTDQDRRLLWDYCAQGFTQEQIAESMNLSRRRVGQLLDRAFRRIIRNLGGEVPDCSGGIGCAGCGACAYGTRRPQIHSPESGANQLAS